MTYHSVPQSKTVNVTKMPVVPNFDFKAVKAELLLVKGIVHPEIWTYIGLADVFL